MAHDERLAERVRETLKGRRSVTEKNMFGGVCFLVGGNMACGVANDDLVVRVGPDAHDAALKEKHARPMDFTGRPLKGMVYVGPGGTKTQRSLQTWVDQGASFAASLPKKVAKKVDRKTAAKKTIKKRR